MARQHWQAAFDEACPCLAGRMETTDYCILTEVAPLEHEGFDEDPVWRGWVRASLQTVEG